MSDKAWWVTPYGEDWGCIVHADTRAQARSKGLGLIDEWNEIRAVRIPELDGKIITKESLLDAGFPEEWEGMPIYPTGYILECGCDLCKKSLAIP